MKRVVAWAGVVVVALFGACYVLLPEEYAVNAPIGWGAQPPKDSELRDRFVLPEGFGLSLYARDLPGARWMHLTPTGDLLVSRARAGEIVLLYRDADGDRRPDGRHTLLEGLNRPHGMAVRDGWLYVGETDAIARIRFDAARRATVGEIERIVTGLPGGGNHWTRTVAFGPDGKLYVGIGSSCNVCVEADGRRAAVLRFDPDGSAAETVATGIRNPVGFDWQPGTGDLYATDNGRDLLGDDFPPCELNLVRDGAFYGWPHANGNRVPDPDLGEGQEARIEASIPPAHAFRAHNAPLGITFLRAAARPAEYDAAALVALHGSWNRTQKDGYKVVSLHWQPGGIEERDFLVGFERGGDVVGRPVAIAEGPSGEIFVSDDFAGAVWRVRHGEETAASQRGRSPTSRAPQAADPLAAYTIGEREAAAGRGHQLYEQHRCASCHEVGRLDPGVTVKPLNDLAVRFDVDGLAALLETPSPPMPVFPLTDTERADVAIYLLDREQEQSGQD